MQSGSLRQLWQRCTCLLDKLYCTRRTEAITVTHQAVGVDPISQTELRRNLVHISMS